MDRKSNTLYCTDLPTTPVPDAGIVLVTGAGGYIGGRLVPELLARGYRVRVMVRRYSDEYLDRWPDAELVIADALNVGQLKIVLKDVTVAYYLIHSMMIGRKEFAASDLQAVTNFRFAAGEMGLKRIIYLGALGETGQPLSPHLESRINVARILEMGQVPATILQAGIIIGSGSASFEILDGIVRNIPFYFIPRWARTKCQPIGIRDVIKYLVGVLETPETAGKTFDIGCDDVLSYKEMIQVMVKLLRKRRLFLPAVTANIRVYSYFISLFSPVPAQIIACLLESVKHEVVVQEFAIRKHIDFPTIKFRVALLRALSREEQDDIATRWSDAYPPAHELAIKLGELGRPPKYISTFSTLTRTTPSGIYRNVCRIGGKQGWFHMNWMWRLRGRIDRILMGVGTSRGRRDAIQLRINDVVDFWRVEDLVRNKRLLLRAEMRVPGRAWLEFIITETKGMNKLSITAYFQPRGLAGRLYWYFFLPFHFFIFRDLLRQLTRESR
ncbi:MAG: SDR family oxidoreductase [Bacteroidales bacterium]